MTLIDETTNITTYTVKLKKMSDKTAERINKSAQIQ